jgi:hypothetical protein
MSETLLPEDLDPGTPADVDVRKTPRKPQWDPTVGIAVDTSAAFGEPRHRLVTIGDSLTHGFQSGAVFQTDVSYPAIIAWELGCFDSFRYPTYHGHGGLPFNIELLLRDLEERYGPTLDGWEAPSALFRVRQFMDEVEDHWERGPGAAPPPVAPINHNLAVFGWDLRDALSRTAETCRSRIKAPKDNLLNQVVHDAGDRAALRVYPTAPGMASLTLFQAAQRLGQETDATTSESGIETLVIALGANNALPAVVDLRLEWSGDGYDDPDAKTAFTVWRPTHFASELRLVAEQVRRINARHVIWCTVPHVTVAPVARGVGAKVRPGSRYFSHYTRAWIDDGDFHLHLHPNLTAAQARAVDSAIDQYNDAIVDVVAGARRDGRDWYVLDVAGVLDRLAQRRYIEDPQARPDWWRPYQLPPELQALTPVPDARFLTSDGGARVTGGLFSLDGVHPTTIGYGIVAQELINVMRRAGVEFRYPDGTPRPGPVAVDFGRLIRRDSLVTRPPAYITTGHQVLGWLEDVGGIWRYARTRVAQLVG